MLRSEIIDLVLSLLRLLGKLSRIVLLAARVGLSSNKVAQSQSPLVGL